MEDICNPKNKRFAVFPIIYKNIYDLYETQLSLFWHHHEIDFSKDYDDYIKLSDSERHAINTILSFFASTDGIVSSNITQKIITNITIPEGIICYGIQATMENIHNVTYSIMLEELIKDKDEKNKLFDAIHQIEAIKKISQWAIDWTDSGTLAENIVAFICIEGILFSSVFAIIFYLKDKHKGKLQGFIKSNEFISRDEGLHVIFGIEMYKLLNNKPSKERIIQIIKESVELSFELADEALQVELLGMNSKLLKQYIEYVADRVSYELLGDKIYKVDNPLIFMNTIGMVNKTNFFEARVSDYQSAFNNDSNIDLIDCNDEDF